MVDVKTDLKRFHEDGQFFDTHYDELLEEYPEHWIAVFHKEVVGTDTDFYRLLDSLKSRGFPLSRMIIKQVTAKTGKVVPSCSMIRGYFLPTGSEASPPYVDGLIDIPEIGVVGLEARFLIDTGADRSLLGDDDTGRMIMDYEVDLGRLKDGIPSQGIGGVVATREVQATLELGEFSTSFRFDVLEPRSGQSPSIPSLLGRDILSHFALFMEERTDRVLLLEPHESDRLQLN